MRFFLLCLLFLTACATVTPPTPNNIFIFELENTGSMEPALSGGDTIYLDRNFPYEELKIGDTIAYYNPDWGIDYGLLHRIIALSKGGEKKTWIVKGDNNQRADKGVLEKRFYRGKMVRVDFE